MFEVGDGSRIRFWEDIWCGERPLKQDFLDVFALTVDPSLVVASNLHTGRRDNLVASFEKGII